jgi:GDP-mannose pyrophosphatase NudK
MPNNIKIIKTEILSQKWSTLKEVTFKYLMKDGTWQTQTREAFGRGNGAAILLYNKEQKSIVLTRQFRLPSYINGNETGMLIEACAGLLDNENPEDCIERETEEETGYRINNAQKIFEVYMSPGGATEMLYFFIAEYSQQMKVHEGGGVSYEQENIEVLEMNIDDALKMIETGEIRDAKTIMLLQYVRLKNIL